jgi:hypothetical protein
MTSWWPRLWHCGLKLWWNRLWVRADEFHPSLDLDLAAMEAMTAPERAAYLRDLFRRREIAHRRALL